MYLFFTILGNCWMNIFKMHVDETANCPIAWIPATHLAFGCCTGTGCLCLFTSSRSIELLVSSHRRYKTCMKNHEGRCQTWFCDNWRGVLINKTYCFPIFNGRRLRISCLIPVIFNWLKFQYFRLQSKNFLWMPVKTSRMQTRWRLCGTQSLNVGIVDQGFQNFLCQKPLDVDCLKHRFIMSVSKSRWLAVVKVFILLYNC